MLCHISNFISFTAPTEDLRGCSDSNSVEKLSEFSSTPQSSVHTTPGSSPIQPMEVTMDVALPSTSGEPSVEKLESKGKDLTLLMGSAGKGKFRTPRDSLYFSEMACTKKTAHKKTGKCFMLQHYLFIF